MAGKGIITMSQVELKRLNIVHKILDKKLGQVDASGILGLCDRQIRRLVARVRKEGDIGIIHKSRGRPSNRAFAAGLKNRVVNLYKKKYPDFGPTFANEKIAEIDKIKIGDQTLRNWLIDAHAWEVSHKGKRHRHWRERRHRYGEMEQADFSHHDWFEGRRPECVLAGYIDDANNNVFARFYEYEGTLPFMASFKTYAKKRGLPHSIYIDRHSTYKSSAKPTIEDELANREPLTQVGRALKELGVEVIFAHSAPAKGRIERLFKTFQDRLVKEMRLRKIKTIKQANRFLEGYLPGFNERFGVTPIEKGDLHRPLPKDIDLDVILCVKEEHPVRKDFTIVHDKKLYQILDWTSAKWVTVEQRLDGRMLIVYKGKALRYKEIAQRPKRKEDKPKYVFTMVRKERYRPPKSHPFKSFKRSPYSQNYSYPQREKVAPKEKGLLLIQNQKEDISNCAKTGHF
jgi:hypothetical protein